MFYARLGVVLVSCLLAAGGLRAQSDVQNSAAQRDVHPDIVNLSDAENTSIDELKRTVSLQTTQLQSSRDKHRVRRTIVAQWAEAHSPESLAVDALEWIVMNMLPEYTGEYPAREIDATWEAQLVPPTTGEYRFALSPLNLTNTREEGQTKYFRVWSKVEVDGQSVLESAPGARVEVGNSVQLKQNEPVRLRFALKYRSAGYDFPLPAAGQLYWEGPEIDKQLVGKAFLSLPGTDKRGVKLDVRRLDKYGEQACSTVVDAIDQVFGKHEIVEYEQLLNSYIDRLVEHFLSPEFLKQALADQSPVPHPHPLVGNPDYRGVMNKCSSKLRHQVATTLAMHPELVGPLDAWNMVYFHDSVRHGAEEGALDLLGAWLQKQSTKYSEPATSVRSYYEKNLKALRHLIIPLVLEHAQSAKWLEDKFFILEDGSCSVPVATVLRYTNLVSLQLPAWTNEIDHRLGDIELIGDQRVTWLIARALAEEIRTCPPHYVDYVDRHQLDAGFRWFDEALGCAESPEFKALVSKEYAARLVAMGRLKDAQQLLAGDMLSPKDGEPLAELKSLTAGLANFSEPRRTFLNELRRRQKHALEQGNTQAAQKYSNYMDKIIRETKAQRRNG